MSDFHFELPNNFDQYEWEVAVKGCFSAARIRGADISYTLSFYDPARLAQEMEDELQRGHLFFEVNLIVIRSVKRSTMKQAAELLIRSGRINLLRPD